MKNLLKNVKSSLFKNVNFKLFSSTQQTTIQPWVEVENRLTKLKSELVLKEHGQIEKYVLNLLSSYYRTTNRDTLSSVSSLEEHGLDSLDALELCCQIEDELGYIIEAEVMPKFSKVKHFINFIKHMEGYKTEHKILPQQKAHESEENWDDWVVNGEKLKAKLYGYTKEKDTKKH